MPKLSDAQIAGLARAAGWTGNDVAVATAVALAESAGNTAARGDVGIQTSKWGPSVGLWQIRSLKAQRGTGGTRDELANLNPSTNAQHAHQVWAEAGGTFSPWSTHTSGAYLLYMPRARSAAGSSSAPGTPTATPAGLNLPLVPFDLPWTSGVVPDPREAASTLETARTALTIGVKGAAWVSNPANWLRVSKVMAGVLLVAGGVALVVRDPAAKVASGALSVVAPVKTVAGKALAGTKTS